MPLPSPIEGAELEAVGRLELERQAQTDLPLGPVVAQAVELLLAECRARKLPRGNPKRPLIDYRCGAGAGWCLGRTPPEESQDSEGNQRDSAVVTPWLTPVQPQRSTLETAFSTWSSLSSTWPRSSRPSKASALR